PQRSSLYDGIAHALAVVLQLVGELNDKDAVLGDEADQGHKPDLAIDVQRRAGEIERKQRPRHRQRHRKHDDQRIDEAFELSRQDQEDETKRQEEDEIDAGSRLFELAGDTVIIVARSVGQHFVRNIPKGIKRLAQRVALGQVRGDGRGAELVGAGELLRRDILVDLDKAGELDHGAVAATDVDILQVVGGSAVVGLNLHDAFVLLAVLDEARHLASAEQRLERPAERQNADAAVGHAVPVDLD